MVLIIFSYWVVDRFIFPLICAVLVGGFAGSYFGSEKYDASVIQKIMGGIIIIAIILLIQRML